MSFVWLATLARFAHAFGREGNDFGTLHVLGSPQPVPAELQLTGQLREFYAHAGFDKLTIGGAFHLMVATLAELPEAQVGWRWLRDRRSGKVTEDPTWNKDWLVFGDRNGDALFADLSQEESPISGSIQGDNYSLASSLESFLNILTDCMLMEQVKFEFDTRTEDFSPREGFIEATRQIVAKYESDDEVEGFMYFFFA